MLAQKFEIISTFLCLLSKSDVNYHFQPSVSMVSRHTP